MDVDGANGTLQLITGVGGSAARMGHRLTISIDEWRAHVELHDGQPQGVVLSADLASMRVLSGAGGLKPLTDGDKRRIKGHALATLHADVDAQVTFTSTEVSRSGATLRVAGDLTIAGATRPLATELQVAGSNGQTTLSGELVVRQTDFGIVPYTFMLGQLRVADDVRVQLNLSVPAD